MTEKKGKGRLIRCLGAVLSRIAAAGREQIALGVNTAAGFLRHDCINYAAAITFFAILSFLPLLLLILSIGGYVLQSIASGLADEADLYRKILDYLGDYIPFLTLDMINRLTVFVKARGTLGMIGAGILLVSSTFAFGALEQALRRVFEDRPRHFLIQRLFIALLVFGLGALLAVSIFFTSLITALLAEYVPFALQIKQALASFPVISYLAPLVLLVLGFVAVMKYFLGGGLSWAHTFAGGAVFALLFTIARVAFQLYLDRLSHLSTFYGSLTAVAVLVLWVYYLANIVLVAAEYIRALKERGQVAAGSGASGSDVV